MATFLYDTSSMEAVETKGVDVEGVSYIVLKHHDGVSVFKNHCPHLGIQLEMLEDEFLDQDKSFLVCSNHGALFELETGLCVAGPCNGDRLQKIESYLEGDQLYMV